MIDAGIQRAADNCGTTVTYSTRFRGKQGNESGIYGALVSATFDARFRFHGNDVHGRGVEDRMRSASLRVWHRARRLHAPTEGPVGWHLTSGVYPTALPYIPAGVLEFSTLNKSVVIDIFDPEN